MVDFKSEPNQAVTPLPAAQEVRVDPVRPPGVDTGAIREALQREAVGGVGPGRLTQGESAPVSVGAENVTIRVPLSSSQDILRTFAEIKEESSRVKDLVQRLEGLLGEKRGERGELVRAFVAHYGVDFSREGAVARVEEILAKGALSGPERETALLVLRGEVVEAHVVAVHRCLVDIAAPEVLIKYLERIPAADLAEVIVGYEKRYGVDLTARLEKCFSAEVAAHIAEVLRNPTVDLNQRITDLITNAGVVTLKLEQELAACLQRLDDLPVEQKVVLVGELEKKFGESLATAVEKRLEPGRGVEILLAMQAVRVTPGVVRDRVHTLLAVEHTLVAEPVRRVATPLKRAMLEANAATAALDEEYNRLSEPEHDDEAGFLLPFSAAALNAREKIWKLRDARLTVAQHARALISIFAGIFIFWIFLRSERPLVESLIAGFTTYWCSSVTVSGMFGASKKQGWRKVRKANSKMQKRRYPGSSKIWN